MGIYMVECRLRVGRRLPPSFPLTNLLLFPLMIRHTPLCHSFWCPFIVEHPDLLAYQYRTSLNVKPPASKNASRTPRYFTSTVFLVVGLERVESHSAQSREGRSGMIPHVSSFISYNRDF